MIPGAASKGEGTLSVKMYHHKSKATYNSKLTVSPAATVTVVGLKASYELL